MIRATAIAAAVIFGAAISAPAAEIIVPTDMPLGVAVAFASSGDTITVLPSTTPYLTSTLSVADKRLTIRGSTGNAGDVVIDGYALGVVMQITGASAAGTVIQDLTITNGRGSAVNGASGAGIVLTTGAHTTFKNVVVYGNILPAADGNGAGIFSNGCNLRLEDCVIRDNRVQSGTGDGAGAYLVGGTHTLVRTTFRNNWATSPASGSYGGGLWAESATLNFVACTFEDGNAWEGGGACIGVGSTAVLDACKFVHNTARLGGGLWVASNAGTVTVRNSLFWGNTSTADNSAAYVGRSVTFTSCTFTGNTASGSWVISGSAGVTLDNSIIWGNTQVGAILYPNQVLARQNILQSAYSGASGTRGNIISDPLFKGASDFTLSPGSPAIDAGDTTLYTGPFADLANGDRGVNDPAVADTGVTIMGPVIDIGAYERQVTSGSACPGDFNNSGAITVQDVFDFLTAFFAGCP